MSYFSDTADFRWNQACIVDLEAGKLPIRRVEGWLTPENMLFMVSFDKKVVFLTVAGFWIFGPHKILGGVKGVSVSHKSELQVHVHHHLGVEGRLAAYELVGPTWHLNVINVHVPVGDATETFLEHLMDAHRQLAMTGLTVIIGDFNAAPSADDRRGQQTPEDAAVQMAMQHLGLQDLTASLRGQPSHRSTQPGSADSRINLCYTD